MLYTFVFYFISVLCKKIHHSSYERSSSNVDDDDVEPASNLVIQDQQFMASFGGAMQRAFQNHMGCVCCNAPPLQIDVETSHYWNLPTPVRRRLSRTQAGLVRPMPNCLKLDLEKKRCCSDLPSEYLSSHLQSVHCAAGVPQAQKCDEIVVSLCGQWRVRPSTDEIGVSDLSSYRLPERELLFSFNEA